jgi:hypothetical protein
MCKANFAASVNEKTPRDGLASRMCSYRYAVYWHDQLGIPLDIGAISAA